jgi:hypothetical protein
VLLLAPPAPPPAGRRTTTLLARLLRPARALAERAWIARRERGVFALVYDALPLERDFVLRTYPMIGIPLAFLLAGAGMGGGDERRGLLALLLFTPAIYLPVLLAHVPATASPGARWILDTAPVPAAAVRNAAVKALALRFLLPLYALLAAIAASLGEGALAARLLPAALLSSLLALRVLYPRIVLDPPLSTAPDEIAARHDWMSLLLTLTVVLVGLAIFAERALTTPGRAALLAAALALVELSLDRAERRRAARAVLEEGAQVRGQG